MRSNVDASRSLQACSHGCCFVQSRQHTCKYSTKRCVWETQQVTLRSGKSTQTRAHLLFNFLRTWKTITELDACCITWRLQRSLYGVQMYSAVLISWTMRSQHRWRTWLSHRRTQEHLPATTSGWWRHQPYKPSHTHSSQKTMALETTTVYLIQWCNLSETKAISLLLIYLLHQQCNKKHISRWDSEREIF